jgi:hypothetical protein
MSGSSRRLRPAVRDGAREEEGKGGIAFDGEGAPGIVCCLPTPDGGWISARKCRGEMESNRGRGASQSMFGFWCLVWCLDVGAGGGDGVAVYRASRCCAWIGGQSRTRKSAAVVKSAQVQGNWKAAQGKHR